MLTDDLHAFHAQAGCNLCVCGYTRTHPFHASCTVCIDSGTVYVREGDDNWDVQDCPACVVAP